MNDRPKTHFAHRLVAAMAGLLLLVGCAYAPPEGSGSTLPAPRMQLAQADILAPDDIQLAETVDEDIDYIETVNRFFFAFNEALDVLIFKPLAATYRFLVPPGVRDSVRNLVRHLGSPVVLANDLFQGNVRRAETTLARIVLNTTIGLGGLFDVADGMGYSYHDEDFGQTMAVHGAGEGMYLVLPIFGPSTARDAIGKVADIFLDPFTYIEATEGLGVARTAAGGIDFRSRNIETIEDLKRDSLDFYARVRSLYLQRRKADINNGQPTDDAPVPGLYSEEGQLSVSE